MAKALCSCVLVSAVVVIAAVTTDIPFAQSSPQEVAGPAASTMTPLAAPASQPARPNFADIVRRVSPAVVTIYCNTGSGSGFVVDPAGYIATNDHVIDGASACEVWFPDDVGRTSERYPAIWVRSDAPRTDLAVLKIEAPKPLPTVTFGDSSQVKVGEWVLAVGSPGLRGLSPFDGTVTAGIVSARSRELPGASRYTEWLQIDAAINGGNSGGPTFNMSGQVIGMNTMTFYVDYSIELKFGVTLQNINFAIPASTIKSVVADLKTGPVRRGFLGVLLEALDANKAQAVGLADTRGALVVDVVDASPASKAGIKPDDVIRKIDGRPVLDDRDCLRQIALLKDSQKASLVIWRDGKAVEIMLSLANRNDFISADGSDITTQTTTFASLGFDLIPLRAGADKTTRTGLLVARVDPDSDAAQLGLSPGDRVVRIGGIPLTSLKDVAVAVDKARALNRKQVLVYVRTRAGGNLNIAVQLRKPQ